ncbi:MAG: hypothetical protein Q9218_005873 [Villophora microphyllina]
MPPLCFIRATLNFQDHGGHPSPLLLVPSFELITRENTDLWSRYLFANNKREELEQLSALLEDYNKRTLARDCESFLTRWRRKHKGTEIGRAMSAPLHEFVLSILKLQIKIGSLNRVLDSFTGDLLDEYYEMRLRST